MALEERRVWGSHHGSESLRHGHNVARYLPMVGTYRCNTALHIPNAPGTDRYRRYLWYVRASFVDPNPFGSEIICRMSSTYGRYIGTGRYGT